MVYGAGLNEHHGQASNSGVGPALPGLARDLAYVSCVCALRAVCAVCAPFLVGQSDACAAVHSITWRMTARSGVH